MASVKDLKKKMKRVVELRHEANELGKSVYDACHCPAKHFEKENWYFSGSYNDHAYTDYWDRCTICGRRHNERSVDHGHFG